MSDNYTYETHTMTRLRTFVKGVKYGAIFIGDELPTPEELDEMYEYINENDEYIVVENGLYKQIRWTK